MTDDKPQTTATARVEAFSDGVFAIALTLLVLDLQPPDPGTFAAALVEDWPSYLAFVVAFITIGSIWLSHHNAFSRVRRADPLVLALNLLLLLGAALVPWPTALISTALRGAQHEDEVAAILVYSLVTVLVGVPWSLLSLHLARHPELLRAPDERRWMRWNARYSAGSVLVAVVAVLIALAAPIASLLLYVVVPAAFAVSSIRARETVDQ